MTQIRRKGSHTWDIYVRYYRCPQCGAVIENRQAYQYHLGREEKHLDCPRCHKQFTVVKRAKHTFGPIFGG